MNKIILSIFFLVIIFSFNNSPYSCSEKTWDQLNFEEREEYIIKAVNELNDFFYKYKGQSLNSLIKKLDNYQFYEKYHPYRLDGKFRFLSSIARKREVYRKENYMKVTFQKPSYIKCNSNEDGCFKSTPNLEYACDIVLKRGNDDRTQCFTIRRYLTLEEIKYTNEKLATPELISSNCNDFKWMRKIGFYMNIIDIDYDDHRCRKENYILITHLLFKRGHYDLDSSGELFWNDNDSNNLYYKYALSINEAIQFVFLHEYAHACGMREKASELFTKNVLLELRKSKRGIEPYIDLLTEDFNEEISDCDSEENLSLIYHGSKPPVNNMPPGTYLD